jgi:hypothetical protein
LFGQVQYWLVPRSQSAAEFRIHKRNEEQNEIPIGPVADGGGAGRVLPRETVAEPMRCWRKSFTEQQIMTAMTVAVLKAKVSRPSQGRDGAPPCVRR